MEPDPRILQAILQYVKGKSTEVEGKRTGVDILHTDFEDTLSSHLDNHIYICEVEGFLKRCCVYGQVRYSTHVLTRAGCMKLKELQAASS